jgi:Cu(I)/Ag(I) efflux system membrane fusion protein
MGGNAMNNDTSKKWLLVGVAAAGVVAGVVGGYFAAHVGMPDMSTGKGGVSAPPGRVGEKESMEMGAKQGMEGMKDTGPKGMQGMEGMKGMQPGAVAIPAVTRQLIGVRTAPVGYAPLEQDIRAVGTVEYDERGYSQVTLKVSGWIREVFVDSVGRPVRKGEPLFTLYSPDLLATQDEYLLALKARAQLDASPLAEAKENASALVASARERLRLWDLTETQIGALEQRGKAEPVLTVYAPAGGIILKREALPGKYVEPNTTLYEMADLSTAWVYADIYESEVLAVKVGQPAAVTFAAYPGEIFRARVSYIYPSLNAEARTVRVRLELPNPGLKLKPGMYGGVTVRTGADRALVVPKEAVLDTGLRQLVYVDKGQGIYQPAPVKLGRKSQDRVEVLEGVKEGDRVVTSANFLLDADSKLASASSMQAMMGRVGMADWQMRGAYEKKMEDMGEREGMEGMKEMPGMGAPSAAGPANETRQSGDVSLTLTTVPEKPKSGENMLRLKLADKAGKAIANAQVIFLYTMPMPGMTDTKVPAIYKGGAYEGKAMLGMSGIWDVTVHVTIPGKPPIKEKFSLQVGSPP